MSEMSLLVRKVARAKWPDTGTGTVGIYSLDADTISIDLKT
ncbi:hypothetical protein JOC76_006105 [Neobacillus cucumis]|nr:hypothetical protein [Neobacillus cucumis]